MLDAIIAQITLGLIDYLAKRVEKRVVATDADLHPELLRDAGARIRDWMQQNRPRQ